MLLVACERERPNRAAPADTTAPIAAVPATRVPPACPATGAWSRCAVLERLDRAGLAPRMDSSKTDEPPLSVPGILLHLGASELEIYLYPDMKSREREEAMLDRTKYVDYAAPLSRRARAGSSSKRSARGPRGASTDSTF